MLQGFSSKETNFYFCQFLSNFFKYSFSNFSLFYLYNILAIYFSSNFSFLKFLSFAISNFPCLLTSILSLPSNSATVFFIFSKFSSFFYVLFSVINLFQCTKYFTIFLIFLLFYLEFLLPPTLQLHLPLPVLLFLLSVPLLVLYITLLN